MGFPYGWILEYWLTHKLIFFNHSPSRRCFLSLQISWDLLSGGRDIVTVDQMTSHSQADLPRPGGEEGGESRRKKQRILIRLDNHTKYFVIRDTYSPALRVYEQTRSCTSLTQTNLQSVCNDVRHGYCSLREKRLLPRVHKLEHK